MSLISVVTMPEGELVIERLNPDHKQNCRDVGEALVDLLEDVEVEMTEFGIMVSPDF